MATPALRTEPVTFTGKPLAMILRHLCDGVHHRLWIASPYIGGPDAIRRVLGRRWWDHLPKDSVRILTDADEGNINATSMNMFRAKGPVRHLRGLHAKLYIIDDHVLLTSANLTRTAFACRYEIGTLITGLVAQQAITHYEQWWNLAADLTGKQIERIVRKRGHSTGEEPAPGLQELHSLPPDPGEMFVHQRFADYEPFRTSYDELAQEYARLGRAWPTAPLYLELDGFLDYLFHHDGKPSHPYTKKAPRSLTVSERRRELRKYAEAFRTRSNPTVGHDRVKRAKALHALLEANNIGRLTKPHIRSVLTTLNCMHDERVKNRVLEHNTTPTIRNAWNALLYGAAPLPERMSVCAARLFGFKRSGVQELLGWYDPAVYPIRNRNTNAGMRFLGYDVRAN